MPENTSALGVSVGSDTIHTALLTMKEGGPPRVDLRLFTETSRRGGLGERITAVLDSLGAKPDVVGIACRTPADEAAVRGRRGLADGSALVVAEMDAIVAALEPTGVTDRYGSVLVVDIGATGTSVYRMLPAEGSIAELTRDDDTTAASAGDPEIIAAFSARLSDLAAGDEALVLVGGGAAAPGVVDAFADSPWAVIAPEDPESVSAVGAARLAVLAGPVAAAPVPTRRRRRTGVLPLAVVTLALVISGLAVYAVVRTPISPQVPGPASVAGSTDVSGAVEAGASSRSTATTTAAEPPPRIEPRPQPAYPTEPRWSTTIIEPEPTSSSMTTVTLTPPPGWTWPSPPHQTTPGTSGTDTRSSAPGSSTPNPTTPWPDSGSSNGLAPRGSRTSAPSTTTLTPAAPTSTPTS